MTLTDGMWAGSSCLIIGGGPSLRGLDWGRVDCATERTIAVNRAGEGEWGTPDLWLGVDANYWRKEAPQDAIGTRVWIDTGDKAPWRGVNIILPCAAPPGLPNRHAAFAWGRSLAEGVGCAGNSGFAALNLAVILGADPIYLLGFDMKGENGVLTHFHSGYREKPPSDVLCERWRAAFAWAVTAGELDRTRVVVLEVTPGDSALTCFPKQPVSEVL